MTQQLPDSWIDRIFARLQGVYGRDFTGNFSTGLVDGVDLGIENTKQVWAEELACFSTAPMAIKYALEHLPTRSPNAIQFREACRVAPTVDASLKITQKLSPEESAAQRLRVKTLINNLKSKMQSKREAK